MIRRSSNPATIGRSIGIVAVLMIGLAAVPAANAAQSCGTHGGIDVCVTANSSISWTSTTTWFSSTGSVETSIAGAPAFVPVQGTGGGYGGPMACAGVGFCYAAQHTPEPGDVGDCFYTYFNGGYGGLNFERADEMGGDC